MEHADQPTQLDLLMPQWDQHEVHRRQFAASSQQVWDALWDLRVRDLSVTTALMRLRGGPRVWRSGVVPGDGDARVMDSMAPTLLIAEEPHEMVLVQVARYAAMRPAQPPQTEWTAEEFAAYAEPGWSKVAMNFRFTAKDGGTELITETRVLSTDAATKRSFTAYWLAIRAGSGLIRRDILRAVNNALVP
ncbi:hypothetical protein P3T36_005501 [Kitasatospora sp. MAP12-15]|uniref:hypothetical protein n=1 Tax=unclassified Kitasatospora TaxID=2633591 RepID=UPI002474D132|nr:hypothetical protein [Kitasatospora sp. MAP12-44]MDH6108599.1 hypothetical protein [Kitasatospora sp. MAP12-44]